MYVNGRRRALGARGEGSTPSIPTLVFWGCSSTGREMTSIRFVESGIVRLGVLAKCRECRRKFPRRKRSRRLYCSRKCSSLSKRQRIKLRCKLCGRRFERSHSKLDKSKSGLFFCSRKCKDTAQRIGGIDEIMPSHYGASEGNNLYRSWIARQKRPKCIGCRENKLYLLCVHHIDGDRSNNVKENFEIVCWNCHAKRHLRFDKERQRWVYSALSLTPRDRLEEV